MTTDNAFWVDTGRGDAPGHGGWRQKKKILKGEDVGVGWTELVCARRPAGKEALIGEGGESRAERERWSLTTSMRLSWIRLRVVLSRLLIRPRLDDSYCKTHTDMQICSQSWTNTLRKCDIMHTHTHKRARQRLVSSHSVGTERIL